MLAAAQIARDNQEAADASDHHSHDLGACGLGYRKSSKVLMKGEVRSRIKK